MSKEKAIAKITARIEEINDLIKDITLPNWCDLVTERNRLSVNLKRMKESRSKYQRRKPYINTVSVKQWGV